jgi:hypothetical protein
MNEGDRMRITVIAALIVASAVASFTIAPDAAALILVFG